MSIFCHLSKTLFFSRILCQHSKLDLLGRVASSSGNNAGKKKFSWDEKFEEKSFRHIMHQLMSLDNQIIYFPE